MNEFLSVKVFLSASTNVTLSNIVRAIFFNGYLTTKSSHLLKWWSRICTIEDRYIEIVIIHKMNQLF